MVVLLWGITGGSPSLLVQSAKPFTGESVLYYTKKYYDYIQTQSLENFSIPKDVLLLSIPSVLVEIFNAGDDALKELAKYTRAVMTGGAALPLEVGDRATELGVNIANGYGSFVNFRF